MNEQIRSNPTTEPAHGSRACLSVTETCRRLSIGRTLFYDLAAEGELVTLRIKGRRLVTVRSIEALIDKQVEEDVAARDKCSANGQSKKVD